MRLHAFKIWTACFCWSALTACATSETLSPSEPPPTSLTDRSFSAPSQTLVEDLNTVLTAQGYKIAQATPTTGFIQATKDVAPPRFKNFFSSVFLGYPKNRVESTLTATVTSQNSIQSLVHLSIQDITVDANNRPIETHGHADPKTYTSVWDGLVKAVPASISSVSPK